MVRSIWSGDAAEIVVPAMFVPFPEDDPSSVSRQAKVDIVAFVLRVNGFPVGDEELSDRTEVLNRFAFEAVR